MTSATDTQKISVLLTDDHALVRGGIKSLLEDEDFLEVIGEAANGQEALEKISQLQPDIVIMDIRMPVMNGLDAVAQLTKNTESVTKAIVLSMHHSEEYILQSIAAGAYGYLLKDAPKEELLKAIKKVHEGEKYFSGDTSNIIVRQYLGSLNIPQNTSLSSLMPKESDESITLTRRQKQILELVLSGLSNKEIAEQLSKSVRTIESHRFSLMKNLGVKNAKELSNRAKELGLID
ncbi:MAG: response regulator transcription factor [Bacteroidota bacterium]